MTIPLHTLLKWEAEARRRIETPLVPKRLSDFLEWVGATPSETIKAICDASQGLPVEVSAQRCKAIFGCYPEELPNVPRRTIGVRAGGRGGKTSRLVAPAACHAAWTVPLPTLGYGEHASALLIAPTKPLALQTLSFVRGYIASKPELRACVVEKGNKGEDDDVGTSERITIKRPHDGKLVDIRIGAATRGGTSARARTLVFFGMDEACFFMSDETKAVTDTEIYRAGIMRLVPGGQAWVVSTPWIQGYGILEEKFEQDWGRHRDTLVATGTTRELNPTWDPDGSIERDLMNDPDNHAREILAIPLPAGTKMFFPPECLELAIDKDWPVDEQRNALNLEPNGAAHYAAADLGFRINSAALALARAENDKAVLAYREELRPVPGDPLKPSVICASFGATCAKYRARVLRGDGHYEASAVEELAKIRTPEGKQSVVFEQWPTSSELVFTEFRTRMAEGRTRLPNDPRLISQMRKTTSKPVPGGTVKVILPLQAGAHGDLLTAAANAIVQVPILRRQPKQRTDQGSLEMVRNAPTMGDGGGF